jgi:hypothetical protein
MIHRHDLGGLWRRRLIAWPDGRSDSDTDVLWLQGPSLYADLRIPVGRPACADARCLRDLDLAMLRFMARQEGFCGRFDVTGGIGTWQRIFDFQPDTGIGDRGTLVFENGVLVERGIDSAYVEHWVRAEAGEVIAVELGSEAGTPGCLVAAGESFIYARGRAVALSSGTTLPQLIDDAASLPAAQDLFDCEISFGRRHGSDWRIERSSHGFREGASLSPVFDEAARTLSIADRTPDGAPMTRTWRVGAQEGALSRWLPSGSTGGAPRPNGRTLEMAGARQ